MASVTAAVNEIPTSNDNGDWGWEPLGSEDEEPDDARAIVTNTNKQAAVEELEGKLSVTKSMSSSSAEKQHPATVNKRAGSFSGKPIQGIVSSPSFLELEKAIGATLSLAANDSGELVEVKGLTPSTSGSFPARLSSTNLTQQKVNQQRLRQHQHQQAQRHQGQNQYSRSPHSSSFGPYGMVSAYSYGSQLPPAQLQSARTELAPFTNEAESRAIILFHSVHVSAAEIRNACSKHGVLYYIRPEFHARGVTFISYFDLRCAISAKAHLAEDLGRNVDASVHYSVMLHAANGNSEESRLVVPSLPVRCSEEEVQSVFERYGQLRTTQKYQGDGPDDGPSSLHQRKTSQTASSDATESGPNSGPGGPGPAADSTATNVVHTAYMVEYYNIQDARLAASELSATSTQLWGTDVAIKFATLDDRKQLLCRQLLATLSRWRTEMAAAAAAYNMSVQQHQHQLHYHQQQQLHAQQQVRPFLPMGMMMALPQQAPMLGVPPAAGFAPAQMAGHVAYGPPGGDVMGHPSYYEQRVQEHPAQHAMANFAGNQTAPQFAAQFDARGHPQVLVPIPGFPGSPLRGAIFPGTNLSNPNLFNLCLLAAQAEAQMQQQQSQLQHQSQQAPQVNAANGDGAHTGAHQDGSAQEQRVHQYPRQPDQSSTAPRSPAPQHHSGPYLGNHAPSTGGQQFSPSHAGGRSGPPPHHHHHQQQHQQLQHQHQQFFPPQYAHHPHAGGHVYQHSNFSGTATPQQQGSNASSPSHQAQIQQQQSAGRRGRAQGQAQPAGLVGAAGGGHQIDTDFALDLKRLEAETETRTTVMVRNIPNKYNQQMLLDEVNAHHEGTYDFFYLPIDFKNRCNVGYCFINFLEPHFIAPFVRTFNGQRWKSFNSEKVCAISFARIQGKQAMIARFQNSSLLEKDDEYRPLLFHSCGPDRGKPEPFPTGNGGGRNKQQQSQPPSAQHSRPSSVSPSPPIGSPAVGPRHLHSHCTEERSTSVSSSHSPVESAGVSA